ncbi:hypothetical protein GUITHDRAFT_120690 [Guillardia theta CCMP2712]|uniref:histone acetyltransferase n=1 Tax=Guillardia theta (strain CCMP2712) TaxID=905079 RepID=L1IA64_GUITC|nr:hypothetical protein GUITHDRAFT_120690 [Guillardia theta CCMP2712]EKX33123.1 hypothetical protein GUITHDRAFT_120690 [Guillardia theta CCMP2712]|eukprot:XP_005820103.1 hypothetical protein GUITHDRAFT_120690 [Guillardia theta CCMP2712]
MSRMTEPAQSMSNQALPHPLTDEILREVLQELPTGARLATETCLSCWKENKFPTAEFISFLQSIAAHSSILNKLFNEGGGQPEGSSADQSSDGRIGQENDLQEGMEDMDVEPLPPTHELCDEKETETDLIQHQKRLQEIKRRQLECIDGKNSKKICNYLQVVLYEFVRRLPISAYRQFIYSVRQYVENKLSAEGFGEVIKTFVDQHKAQNRDMTGSDGMTVYGNQNASKVLETLAAHKAKKKVLSQTNAIDGVGSTTTPRSNVMPDSLQMDEKDLSDEDLTILSRQLGRQLGPFSQYTTAEYLMDTPLGSFLTQKARAICSRPILIKVVADVLRQRNLRTNKGDVERQSGLPFRCKAIFAFQLVDSGPHMVLCFGMYVHEYGPGCAPEHSGRIYIEVKSVSLSLNELVLALQALLSAIVLGYFDYVRNMGFQYAHMRVPPPTEENRYHRLLQSAMQARIIASFEAGQAGQMSNFPLSLLDPAEMAAEIAFQNADLRALDQQTAKLMEASRVQQLQERFFLIHLLPAGAKVNRSPDIAPLLASSVASDRHEFVSICVNQRLRFASLQQAKYATIMLVHRIMAEQCKSAQELEDEQNHLVDYPAHQAGGQVQNSGPQGAVNRTNASMPSNMFRALPSQERKFFGASMPPARQAGYYESMDGFPNEAGRMGGMYVEPGGVFPAGQMGEMYMDASMRRAYPPQKLAAWSGQMGGGQFSPGPMDGGQMMRGGEGWMGRQREVHQGFLQGMKLDMRRYQQLLSRRGYNRNGYNRRGYNKRGYNRRGYNRRGYNRRGYNKRGYNKRGYNKRGYNKRGYKTGLEEDEEVGLIVLPANRAEVRGMARGGTPAGSLEEGRWWEQGEQQGLGQPRCPRGHGEGQLEAGLSTNAQKFADSFMVDLGGSESDGGMRGTLLLPEDVGTFVPPASDTQSQDLGDEDWLDEDASSVGGLLVSNNSDGEELGNWY